MVKKINAVVIIVVILLLYIFSRYNNKIETNLTTPQIEFFEHTGYQNPEVISDGVMVIYLWGQIKNACECEDEEIKDFIENQYNLMQLCTSEGNFDIKNSLLSIEDKDDEKYNLSYCIFIEPIDKSFDVLAVKYFDKSENKIKIENCGEIKVCPRNYCEPKIAFCYEAPIKAVDNTSSKYCLTYYICLPTLKENSVDFEVEGECCYIQSFEEDFDVEKDLVIQYENEKSKDELAGLRAYKIELSVDIEQQNMVLDPVIQIEFNNEVYECMTHPIVLNSEN